MTPYKETSQHGPNFLEPPPDILEGEPKWEVEKILQARCFRQTKKKKYLVRWKGYSPSHDSWADKSDMNTPDLVKEYYKSHPIAVRATSFPALYPANYASQDDLNNSSYSDNSSHMDNSSHSNNGYPVI